MSWTASAEADLKEYQVRAHPGPKYKTDEETQVATAAKTATALETNYGLGIAGATQLFKVYVVLESDKEKGSNVVKVVRG